LEIEGEKEMDVIEEKISKTEVRRRKRLYHSGGHQKGENLLSVF
jgi:hypothetical protein